MKTVLLNQFNGGIVNDPRDPRKGVCKACTNFDALTNPFKLTPYRDSESVTDGAGSSGLQNFCVALRTGTTYSLYALGHETSQVYARVYYKNMTSGSTTDLGDSGWQETANNVSASGAVNYNLWVYYKKTGLIYGARAGTHIFAYDPSGVSAFADTHRSISYSNISQGLVHSKDDILYIPYDNKIAKNDNGSWTDAALTLPSHYIVTSIAEYGNYLAIACAHVDGVSNSRVFLWDRDSTLTTLAETIDWGEGALMVIEEVDGVLIGISQSGGAATSYSTIPNADARFSPRIIFRQLSVTEAVKFHELVCESILTYLPSTKQKIDNRLHFNLYTTHHGTRREGVWSIGRSTPTSAFTLIHERTPNNDTALTTGTPKSFFYVGDYLFQSFTTNGTITLSKTNNSSSYTATSILETVINPEMPRLDYTQRIKIYAVGALYDGLPTNGQVVVKHKVQNGTFKTIFTETTDSATFTEPVPIYSDGTAFEEGKEHEFRIESTGGAVVAGLIIRYDILSSNA